MGQTQWFCLSAIEAGVSPGWSDMQSTGVVLDHRELPLELTLQCQGSDLGPLYEHLRPVTLQEKEITIKKSHA